MRRTYVVLAATVVAASIAYTGTQAHAAPPPVLATPTYASTLVGPGVASMYPVDVTSSTSDYFVLDAGNYRLLAVNRTTHATDFQTPPAPAIQGGGPGQFGDARAVAYDPTTGDVFVADTPNNRVEVFSFSSTTGFTYVAQFGAKGTNNGQFTQAYGVAIDSASGWVYVTDGAGRVEKFSSSSPYTYISQFGSGALNQPRQIDVAPNTNHDVFIMDARNHTCDVYSSAGVHEFSFGGLGKGNGQFTDDPRGVAVSADGTLAFVTDSGGKRIETFSLVQSGGHYASAAFAYTIASGTGSGAFVGPRGLTATSDNHITLSDEWGFNWHEFSFTSSSATPSFNSTPTAPPTPGVNSPRGIRVVGNQVYMVDYWNQRIEYMGTDGSNPHTFGVRGNPNQLGAINFAWDAAIQPTTGDVFVANRENHQIEVFSATGTPIVIWGKRGTANGQFTFPQGIAFAPDGTLVVDDSGNSRVQRFTIGSNSIGTWKASYGKKGTGVGSPAGDLNMPTGIAVAADGTVWVADTLNNRVQSLSTGGVWTVISKPIGTGHQKGFNVPWGVTVAPDGSIWVSDTGNNRVVSMDTTGNLIFSATGTTMNVPGNQTIYPFAIAFDSTNHAYLSDIWNNRVLVLNG